MNDNPSISVVISALCDAGVVSRQDLANRADQPLANVLTHVEIQSVTAYVLNRTSVDRGAFGPDTTLLDIADWLGRDGSAPPAPPRRGSYETRSVHLRPLQESDVNAIYRASLAPRSAHRWRYRGHTPSPEAFRQGLFAASTIAQFMLIDSSSGSAVGCASGYSADLASGHCYFAAIRTSELKPGLVIEGSLCLLDYLFDHFELRKIYLEVPEYNAGLFPAGPDSPLHLEGELPGHYRFGGKEWAQRIYAVYREDWDRFAQAVWPC